MILKSPTDSLTFLGQSLTWTAPVPFDLSSNVFDPEFTFAPHFGNYYIGIGSRQCAIRCYDFQRIPATWLSGVYTARHKFFTLELILKDGQLVKWRHRSVLSRFIESRVLAKCKHVPHFDPWLAKSLSAALRDTGLTDATKVIAAYQLNPKEHGAIDELLHRFHTPFGIESAKRLNKKMRTIPTITEQDYERWLASYATSDSCLIGMHVVGRPRFMSELIFKTFVKIMSLWVSWKPILLMDSLVHELRIGGVKFPLDSHKSVRTRER
jgi:hypothetical protein